MLLALRAMLMLLALCAMQVLCGSVAVVRSPFGVERVKPFDRALGPVQECTPSLVMLKEKRDTCP